MLLTSWLSSLRSNRFRKHPSRRSLRKRQLDFARQAEQLEDRTLLTVFIIESLDNSASPGMGVTVTNADIIGSGTQANPEFDSLVIETMTLNAAGINIDLDNIALQTLVIESITITDYVGEGISIHLDGITGLQTLVIESINVQG